MKACINDWIRNGILYRKKVKIPLMYKPDLWHDILMVKMPMDAQQSGCGSCVSCHFKQMERSECKRRHKSEKRLTTLLNSNILMQVWTETIFHTPKVIMLFIRFLYKDKNFIFPCLRWEWKILLVSSQLDKNITAMPLTAGWDTVTLGMNKRNVKAASRIAFRLWVQTSLRGMNPKRTNAKITWDLTPKLLDIPLA